MTSVTWPALRRIYRSSLHAVGAYWAESTLSLPCFHIKLSVLARDGCLKLLFMAESACRTDNGYSIFAKVSSRARLITVLVQWPWVVGRSVIGGIKFILAHNLISANLGGIEKTIIRNERERTLGTPVAIRACLNAVRIVINVINIDRGRILGADIAIWADCHHVVRNCYALFTQVTSGTGLGFGQLLLFAKSSAWASLASLLGR